MLYCAMLMHLYISLKQEKVWENDEKYREMLR